MLFATRKGSGIAITSRAQFKLLCVILNEVPAARKALGMEKGQKLEYYDQWTPDEHAKARQIIDDFVDDLPPVVAAPATRRR